MFVAIGEGYFEDEGLEVTVEAINGSAAVLQALSAGQAHFGRPGPGPVIAARSRGVDAVFIYNVAARSNFGIVVREESEITGPEGLRGKVIGTGRVESLNAAANIFIGQTEAPLVIRPYIAGMTSSELHAVMCGGFATVAGGVMAAYVGFLQGIPGIAGRFWSRAGLCTL